MNQLDTADTAASPTTAWSPWRLVTGNAQSLAVWVLVVAVGAALRGLGVTGPVTGWSVLALGLLGSVTLAWRHWHNGRPDTAVGAYLGAATWPLLCVLAVAMTFD
jgi:hypothetical protein